MTGSNRPIRPHRTLGTGILQEVLGKKVYSLPTSLPHPDDVCHWVGCGATRSNVYLVWFNEAEMCYEYGPKEFAASLPGMQIEATLKDGIIFKKGKDSCNNTEHLDKQHNAYAHGSGSINML